VRCALCVVRCAFLATRIKISKFQLFDNIDVAFWGGGRWRLVLLMERNIAETLYTVNLATMYRCLENNVCNSRRGWGATAAIFIRCPVSNRRPIMCTFAYVFNRTTIKCTDIILCFYSKKVAYEGVIYLFIGMYVWYLIYIVGNCEFEESNFFSKKLILIQTRCRWRPSSGW
jgi:hypothetical protein